MFYESLYSVVEKYGEHCKLNKKNIKDIYLLSYCNGPSTTDIEITKYLENHYTREEILQWNDECINQRLDKCFSLLGNMDWNSISNIGTEIASLCNIFTFERKTYERIITFLVKFYTTYGYFMNYSFLKRLPIWPYEDKSFNCFWNIYIKHQEYLTELDFCAKSTGVEWRYLKSDGYTGLIPRLCKLGYKDLFDRVLVKLVIPIFEHLYEKNDLMKKYDIEYLGDDEELSKRTFRGLYLRQNIESYVELYSLDVPNEIKKYL